MFRKLPGLMKMNNKPLRRLFMTQNHLNAAVSITSVDKGNKFTEEYKKYASVNGKIISYFHDVALDLDIKEKTCNMIVEIPRWSQAKFEINTQIVGNPITQDTKKGKVRFIKNVFPHKGYIHNYGALPRTWEDATYNNKDLNLYGDNDPLDVVDISDVIVNTGDIVKVKVLGSLALIDDGELDWKVIVVNTNDPMAESLSGIEDVIKHCPSLLETTRNWFKNYKLPDGKPENTFAFNGDYKNQQETINIINETHESWDKLINQKVLHHPKLPVIKNTTVLSSPGYVSAFDDKDILITPPGPDAEIPDEINKSYYF